MQKRFLLLFIAVFVSATLVVMPLSYVFAQEEDTTTTDTDSTTEVTEDQSQTADSEAQDETAQDETADTSESSDTSDISDTEVSEQDATDETQEQAVEEESTEEQVSEDSEEDVEGTDETAEQEDYDNVDEELAGDESASSEEGSVDEDAMVDFEKIGQLVEIEGTEVPTSVVITEVEFTKNGPTFKDQYTINIYDSTELDFQLNWWMAGDLIKVEGEMNESTGLVDATEIKHLSHGGKFNIGHNGWIDEINTEENYLQVQWFNELTKVNIIDETRIIIPGIGDVTINDLKLQDRVRIRGAKVADKEINAKTIIVLRRGKIKFVKLRTKKFLANYVGMQDENTFTVEGRRDTYTVHLTDYTKILINKEKQADMSNFSEGDRLFLVARLNDDGTLDAKVVRDFVGLNEGGSIVGVVGRIDETNGVIILKFHHKKFRVDIDENTEIVDEDGNTLTVSDLERGHRIRVEGTKHESLPLIAADTITVIDTTKLIHRVKRVKFVR